LQQAHSWVINPAHKDAGPFRDTTSQARSRNIPSAEKSKARITWRPSAEASDRLWSFI